VGLALGLLARATGAHPGDKSHPLAMALSLVGSSFITLLRATVAPLVFAAIVASVARLGELNNAARLAAQTFLWFAITALIAVSIGIILGLTLQPGLHSGAIAADAAQPHTVGSWLDFIKGLIPANILGLAASTKLDGTSASTAVDFNILQVVVIALAIGSAALHSGEAGQRFLGWTSDLLVVLRKLLGWVIRLAPIGTAALIGNAVVQYGWDTLSRLGLFAGALYLGLALVVGVVYPACWRCMACRRAASMPRHGPRCSWLSSRVPPPPLCRWPRWPPRSWVCRAPMPPSPCRLPRPPRWMAVRRFIPLSPRSLSRSSTASRWRLCSMA
jgi:Na+/H+-dicarboxylate symporter